MTAPALQIQHAALRFTQGFWRSAAGPPALDGASLTVAAGERVGLIGESGSGKTTLARVAMGLLPLNQGSIQVLGRPVTELRRDRGLRRRAQMLFQNPDAHLNPRLRVSELLGESARLHRRDADPVRTVQQALDDVGLGHRADALPLQLSGGEKRRVGIARLLMARPQLIVADEPTAGLDADLKADIIDLLLHPAPPPPAILLISHDLPLVAYACSRLAVMLGGRIVERFPVEALRGDAPPIRHPYSMHLFAAAGMPQPGALEPPVGRASAGPACPYLAACPHARERCATDRPPTRSVSAVHSVACHFAEVAP